MRSEGDGRGPTAARPVSARERSQSRRASELRYAPTRTEMNVQSTRQELLPSVAPYLQPTRHVMEYVSQSGGRPMLMFGNLVELYLKHQVEGKPSYGSMRRCADRYLAAFRDREVSSIKRLEFLAWQKTLQHTPSAANHALTVLRAAWRWG